MEFMRFFDERTMSVHLKENMPPLAKKGTPGSMELARVSDEPVTGRQLDEIMDQVLSSREVRDAGVELSKEGATVVQYKDYRIASTEPPFSDAHEVTIVHPVVKMSLGQYDMSDKLRERLSGAAEGIVVAGPPGSGKSTLASGLANFYHSQGRVVKTFESPRDLQVDPGVTQYTKLDGSFENTADVLLLVRPDYTVFDEVRRVEDFRTFSDLRLTGVGMIGVVHANTPLDSIQRFIGKVELGIIPHVLDTVIFVRGGRIERVYGLALKIKVPSGMVEQDLARPVIEVTDFESERLEYEIYTFGEENVIIPVQERGGGGPTGLEALAQKGLRAEMRRYDPDAEVEIVPPSGAKVHLSKSRIAAVIGRGGSNIKELEKSLGIRLDIVEREGGGRDGGAGPRGGGGGRGRGGRRGRGRGRGRRDEGDAFEA